MSIINLSPLFELSSELFSSFGGKKIWEWNKFNIHHIQQLYCGHSEQRFSLCSLDFILIF